jgi:hypothetical protein
VEEEVEPYMHDKRERQAQMEWWRHMLSDWWWGSVEVAPPAKMNYHCFHWLVHICMLICTNTLSIAVLSEA